MITRNLEQLIIPQPSVQHKTTQERAHITERPTSVANSRQNHFSTVGKPSHQKFLRFSPYLPLPLQSRNQSRQQTPSVARQPFSKSSVPPQSTSINVPSSSTVTFWELPVFLSQSH